MKISCILAIQSNTMVHEIFNLKCCDGIAPFNNYGQNVGDKGDCMLRSTQVSNLTGNTMNFGMVYQFEHDAAQYTSSIDGYVCNYAYHCWTESGNNLYESCRQWEKVFLQELDTDQLVMMFDLSYIKCPTTLAQCKILYKEIRKKINFAKSKGINIVYFSGISFKLDLKEGTLERWKDWKWFNKEADYAEEAIEKYFAGEEVPQLYI